jgi:ribonucleoside-diphosphate reductase alpha chain
MQLSDWLETELQQNIWKYKYQYNNETLDEFFNRISNGNKHIKNLMIQKKFLPAGRILSNRGLQKEGRKVSYSNCYVVTPPQDNIESIFDCATKLARTYSYGGGCGTDISKLSPRGAKINNAAKETTGSVSFMDLYSLVTGLIGQQGRRGALMISIDCDHPDIEEFINIKNDINKVNKANISIKITDEFMNAVKNDEDFDLKFTRQETGESIIKTVKAKELFRKIAESNWNIADPGFMMWDRITKWNLLYGNNEFEFACTNPCGELPLPAGGSCLLSSLNLSKYIANPFTNKAYFDYPNFIIDIKKAVIFMNEVLDEGLPLHPLKEQRESVANWRQIGVGIMGLADAFIKMNIKYGSEESIVLSGNIAKKMIDSAICQSALLAEKEGSYPKYNKESLLKNEFYINNTTDTTKVIVEKYGLRNSQLLTIAPTGSLSTMLNISGGIEPIFELSYTRKTESLHGKDQYYKVYTGIVKEFMDENNIANEKDLPEYFVTAMNINYKNRINVQATWQKYIDNSISSTVNVPESFTIEDVEDLYMYAWESGIKGITIYRTNCKKTGILTIDKKENEEFILDWGTTINSSDDLIGRKRKLMSGCGSLHLQAWFDPCDGKLLEIFISKGSEGGCLSSLTALSRTVSAGLRTGVAFDYIIDQLKSAPACPSYVTRTATKKDTSKGKCCPDAIANALVEMQKEVLNELFEVEEEEHIINKKIKNPCPNCGEELRFEEGCNSCPNCGWSKCN